MAGQGVGGRRPERGGRRRRCAGCTHMKKHRHNAPWLSADAAATWAGQDKGEHG